MSKLGFIPLHSVPSGAFCLHPWTSPLHLHTSCDGGLTTSIHTEPEVVQAQVWALWKLMF